MCRAPRFDCSAERKKEKDLKLIYVRAARSRGYLTLGISDGGENKTAFTVSEEDYSSLGTPLVGTLFDGGAMEVIRESDLRYRAALYALRILSYGDNTKKKLYTKLLSRGIRADIAREVVYEMVARGYIDEQRQLMHLIERAANEALIGPQKIKAKLLSQGFSSSDIEDAIANLTSSGDVDFSRSAELLIEKKLTRGATEEEKKKLLYKNGYGIC